MHPINAYLAVANVGATMDFLERAFGFTRGVVLTEIDGQVRYAEMRHGDSVVMLIRKGDAATATAGAAALYTYVTDVDGAATQARQAGAGVADVQNAMGRSGSHRHGPGRLSLGARDVQEAGPLFLNLNRRRGR
jgi:uncharacterized glyoxalase superfamily protein PhnB